ncbi:MAG: antibiotic biosynthesis monooxygenase [Chthoniobacterales bacterium]
MNAGGGGPCTVMAVQRVRPEMTEAFLRLQEETSAAMQRFPGFLGKELIRPRPGLQEEWVAVFRFASTRSLRCWLESEERRTMLEQMAPCTEGSPFLQIVAGEAEETPPITVVFSHRVKRGCEDDFNTWRDEILQVMSAWPGFLGVDVFDPRPDVQDEWIHICRFGSAASYEGWMASPGRAACVAKLPTLVADYTTRPLASGLGGWFAFDDAPERRGPPPAWKQAFLVTLGLYPTVMLFMLLVNPWFKWLPFPLQMIFSNIVCVTLLTWPVMPWLNRRFGGWLSQPERRWAGGLLIVTMLLAWVIAFVFIWRNFSI